MSSSPLPSSLEHQPRANAGSLMRRAARWLERGLALFGALIVISWLTVDVSIVVSPSMSPTLNGTSIDNGDRLVTEKITPWFRSPRRWEVITFVEPNGEKRMKRVIGLPGETVEMLETGELRINGEHVDFPMPMDRKYLRFGNLLHGKPIPCGEGYYVLGDDWKDSDDSRFNGPVPAKRILGRAWIIVWPSDRIGFVH